MRIHKFFQLFTVWLLWTATSLGITSAAAEPCGTLEVVYQTGELSGRYEISGGVINGAPVYEAINLTAPPMSKFSRFYLYRHRVGFTQSGFVWVTQPVTPAPNEWLANSYGEGETPEAAKWKDGITVTCIDAPVLALPTPVPTSPTFTLDLMVVYTEQADKHRNAICLRLGNGTIESSCAVDATIRRQVKAFQDALWRSGLTMFRVNLVHLGSTPFESDDLLRHARSKYTDTLSSTELASFNRAPRKVYPPLFLIQALIDGLKESGETKYLDRDNRAAIAELHNRRQKYGADIVHVVVGIDNEIPICGIGLPGISGNDISLLFSTDLYSLTQIVCHNGHGDYAMAHEIGHNLGLLHDAFTKNYNASRTWNENKIRASQDTEYRSGYVDLSNRFFTIMAYTTMCQTFNPPVACSLYPQFSNPDQTGDFQNKQSALGSTSANAAKFLKRSFPKIAGINSQPPNPEPSVWPITTELGEMDYRQHRDIRFTIYNPGASPVRFLTFPATDTNTNERAIELREAGTERCLRTEPIPAGGHCSMEIRIAARATALTGNELNSKETVLSWRLLEQNSNLLTRDLFSTVRYSERGH